MTTSAELRKHAISSGFVKKLEELGFIVSPKGFWFYRERGEFIDSIHFWISSSKNWISVPIICHKKNLVSHCNMDKFPNGYEKDLPSYSSTFVNEEYGVEIGSEPWKIESDSDIETTLSELFPLIVSSAEPWFKKIDSDRNFYESFTVNFKESETAENIRSKLSI